MTTDLRPRLDAALGGRYTIERELGAGGMATVYLAEDVRHRRRVAVKVLHPELSAVLGPDRFLKEIELTASLQHPHILPLFDSGEAGGQLYYVMPFVDGETLRARLERERQLPVADALRVAGEVADALAYAHARGVVHRDVKPENILLQGGHALVADFGIALAVQEAGGARMTQTGLSLGTPQYMAPEQAMGDRAVDARADVYALGAVTYEMLGGEPPFTGPTAQAIVARVITERPRPLAALRDTVPAHVAAAVETALAKLAADRFPTASEFALALRGPSDAAAPRPATHAVDATPDALRRSLRRWRLTGGLALGTAALLAAALAVALARRPAPPDAPVIRAHLDLRPGETVLSGLPIALSPRGDRIAYGVQGPAGVRTVVQRLDDLSVAEIAAGSVSGLAFSPDGRWVAYAQGDNTVQKVRSEGGPAVVVGTSPVPVIGIAWSPSGDALVIGSPRGLWTMPASGGAARRVVGVDSTAGAALPVVLGDGETVLYSSSGGPALSQSMAASLRTGGAKPLGLSGGRPLGVVAGQLVYAAARGPVMAAPFDVRSRRLTGEAVQVEGAAAAHALSASGTLALVPEQTVSRLVLASRDTVRAVLEEPRRYMSARFSPDGRRIALAIGSVAQAGVGGQNDIWVYDLGAHTLTRLTSGGDNGVPEWSPDGTRILYRVTAASKRTIWSRPADGSADAAKLLEVDQGINEALWSPDGAWLIYRTAPGGARSRDILALPLTGGDRRPVPLVAGPAAEMMPRISPDGRWLAYQSDENGRADIYVRPFPGPGARIQVSDAGGVEPLWARSGRVLYYRTQAGLLAVDVTAGATFAIGARRVVLAGDYLSVETTHANWDVGPDGRSFLMLQPVDRQAAPVVVHNWGRTLQERQAQATR